MIDTHSIENKLQEINDAKFQELCDRLLQPELIKEGYYLGAKLGSVLRREKTRKGTPDTFYSSDNGHYLFVEYSTDLTRKEKKLKGDIRKCLDPTKTGVDCNKIDRIILCFNFKLTPKQDHDLRTMVPLSIGLRLLSIDWITETLATKHPDIAHEYLGLPMDTDQLISIEEYIKRYRNATSRIGTPLDNPFFDRETEIDSIKCSIRSNVITIVSGPQGVGKTRLCIQALLSLKEEAPGIKVLCVCNQWLSIINDLSLCRYNREIVLFIDDANRLDIIEQIIAYTDSVEDSHIKLIMSVRDYALNDVKDKTGDRQINIIELTPLSNETLTKIISGEPFNIKNHRYIRRILDVSKGSPRLAIMASKHAKVHSTLHSLFNIGNLFEDYFSTYANETGIIKNKEKLQVAGVFSFFEAVNATRYESIEEKLKSFGVNPGNLSSLLAELQDEEVLYQTNGIIRIPEQNLRDFIFYHAFLEQRVIPFSVLLKDYFKDNKLTLEDRLVSISNIFGYDKVVNAIKAELLTHFVSLKPNFSESLLFIERVFPFIPNESFDYLATYVSNLPSDSGSKYSWEEGRTTSFYNTDSLIRVLNKTYQYPDYIEKTVIIGYLYTKKRPTVFDEWLNGLLGHFEISSEDYSNGLQRQINLISSFKNISSEGSPVDIALEKIVIKLLEYQFTTACSMGSQMTLRTIELKDDERVRRLRALLWDCIPSLNRIAILRVLDSFIQRIREADKQIIQNDLEYVIPIINTSLQRDQLKDCLVVHDLVSVCKHFSINHDSFDSLEKSFTCPQFEFYNAISWDNPRRLISKEDEKRISESLQVDSLSSFREMYDKIHEIHDTVKKHDRWQFPSIIHVLLHNMFMAQKELGYEALKFVERDNFCDYVPSKLFAEFIVDHYTSDEMWNAINSPTPHTWRWKLCFLQTVKTSVISDKDKERFWDLLRGWEQGWYLFFPHFEELFKVFPHLVISAAKYAYSINAKANKQVIVINLYPDNYKYLSQNKPLLKKIYLQQITQSQDEFFMEDLLFSILDEDISFLLDYVKALIEYDNKHSSLFDSLSLGRVWKINGIEDVLDIIISYMVNNDLIADHGAIIISLFRDIQSISQSKIDLYLTSIVERYNAHKEVMDLVVCIVHRHSPSSLTSIIRKYIEINKSISDFKSINWVNRGICVYVDDDPREHRLALWYKIKSCLNSINNVQITLFQSYVDAMIAANKIG